MENSQPQRIVHRLHFLDVIRGIAAFAVVVEHGTDGLYPGIGWLSHHVFNPGKLGVTLFFLTSGFVIPLTLEAGNSLKKFWLSRLFRLFPLYWLSLALGVAGAVWLGWKLTPTYTDHLLRNSLMNITMLQGILRIPNCFELYYTLTLELMLYGIMSVLFLFKLHKETYKLAWIGVVGATVATSVLPWLAHRRTPLAGVWLILCFFFGTLIYRVYSNELPAHKARLVIGVGCIGMVPGIYVNYVRFVKAEEPFTFAAVALPYTLGLLGFVGLYMLRARPLPRALVFLGTVSYSMYLMNAFASAVAAHVAVRWVQFTLNIGLTIAISACTYRWVEKPFIGLGRRAAKRLIANP